MYFDRLCAIAERFIPEVLPALHQARIFQFPGRWHEVAKEYKLQPDELLFLQKTFFLPFPFVAIEDTASCIVIWDSEPDQQGFTKPRYFVECMPLAVNSDEFADGHREIERAKADSGLMVTRDMCVISAGVITDFIYTPNVEKPLCYKGFLHWSMLADKDKVYVTPQQVADCGDSGILNSVLRNVSSAIEEMFFFNSPSRFVVSMTPKKVLEVKSPNRVVRSPFRQQYTLLTPREIRQRLAHKDPESGKPLEQGHERRKHYRKLTSDHFKEKKGQTITIPAHWVGPSEGVYKGTRYKVQLDM